MSSGSPPLVLSLFLSCHLPALFSEHISGGPSKFLFPKRPFVIPDVFQHQLYPWWLFLPPPVPVESSPPKKSTPNTLPPKSMTNNIEILNTYQPMPIQNPWDTISPLWTTGCGEPSLSNNTGWHKIFLSLKQTIVVKVHNHWRNFLKINSLQN